MLRLRSAGARKKLQPFFVPHVRDDLAFIPL